VKSLNVEGRAPSIVALENVCGALSSHNGKDFASICEAMMELDYTFGAIVIDAALFLPQSRPRLFIIATKRGLSLPTQTTVDSPHPLWHTKALLDAHAKLPDAVKDCWTWWTAPVPNRRQRVLSDIIEAQPTGVSWHDKAETQRLLDMMSDLNRAKVREVQQMHRKIVGTVYKRTRQNEDGKKVQRAEVRFDSVAGCLRTPAGGSSRQLILVIEGDSVRSRLLSSRETARLMGLPDDYALPSNYNEAYHLTGDGVAVPVVRHLAEHIFEPVLEANKRGSECAA
jgi:DNA (cytosine-5)-methyltransferase 1